VRWRARTIVRLHSVRRASRPQLKRDPLGGDTLYRASTSMAYQCPRCGQPVRRGYSRTAQHTAGLIGALFYAAFGSFQCVKCGAVASSEFPAEVRTRMATGSFLMAFGGIVLIGFVLWLASKR